MKKIVLFSTPTRKNIDAILKLIFPNEIENKVFSYMPSDGSSIKQQYLDEWKGYARENNAKFQYIDNSTNDPKETEKLLNSNILTITGGNTFKLLHNLRKSGLDEAIKKFVKKDEFVLSGFSAGALVLTPTIEVCKLPNYDTNEVGLEDLTGLELVNFEVFPHYSEEYKEVFEKYKNTAKYDVKEITDDDFIVLNT